MILRMCTSSMFLRASPQIYPDEGHFLHSDGAQQHLSQSLVNFFEECFRGARRGRLRMKMMVKPAETVVTSLCPATTDSTICNRSCTHTHT